MKKVLYLVIATIALSSCIHIRTIFPSGDIITLSRPVSSFNKVDVCAGISLYAYNGEQEVLIETYENIQNHVQVYVRNNTLYIKPENQISFGGNTRIRAYVTAEVIESIEASGGSKVTMNEGLTANSISLEGAGGSQFEGSTESKYLEIDISGGGKCNLYVDCANLDVEASGGSKLEFSGIADRMELDMSGGSRLDGFNLATDELNAEISGGGRAEITVKNYISGSLSGGADLIYRGDPRISVNTTGGSKVIKD